MIPARLALLYLICCTSPAHSADCGRVIMQFNGKAEDLTTYVKQADSVVMLIQASPNAPPTRATIDWLIPFVQSIETAKAMVAIHRISPECFNFGTREIENGIADRERILAGIANIVRGNMRGLKPQ